MSLSNYFRNIIFCSIVFCAGYPFTSPAQNATFNLLQGEEVYSSYCSACHGVAGDGKGPAAAAMNPAPRDFTNGVYKFRSTPSGALPTDEDLIKVINKGIPGTWMPGWKGIISEKQSRAVISFIKMFLNAESVWDQPLPAPYLSEIAPEKSPDLINNGHGYYLLFDCWTCHGFEGKGKGPSSKTLKDSRGKLIKSKDLTRKDYKAGFTPHDIRKTFLTGLSGTPMPSYEGVFLIAKEDIDEEVYSLGFPKTAKEKFHDFVLDLPSRSYLDGLSDDERRKIIIHNEWSLVYYVQSLVKNENWIDWLFRNSPDRDSISPGS
ncbi:MAG: c-type cytochrome [Candidatus Neomarinimicrobiota bacterium]